MCATRCPHMSGADWGLQFDVMSDFRFLSMQVDTASLDGTGTYPTFGFGVAVKMLQDESQSAQEDFLCEAAIAAQFHDEHVVGLLGVVTRGQPRLLVMQLCERGALATLVKNSDPTQPELLSFALGIAKGMTYLVKLHFVHRDLAARNVLVDGAGLAKVADFGLSRDLEEATYYAQSAEAKLPLRWCAPEVLEHQRFTEKSDVGAASTTPPPPPPPPPGGGGRNINDNNTHTRVPSPSAFIVHCEPRRFARFGLMESRLSNCTPKPRPRTEGGPMPT